MSYIDDFNKTPRVLVEETSCNEGSKDTGSLMCKEQAVSYGNWEPILCNLWVKTYHHIEVIETSVK